MPAPGIGEPRPAALEHRISRVAIDPSLKPARTATLRGVCQAFVPHFAQGSRIGAPDPAHPVPGEAASNARTEIQPAGARAVLGVRPNNKGQAACNNPGLGITIFGHRPAIEKHGPPFLFGIILGLPPGFREDQKCQQRRETCLQTPRFALQHVMAIEPNSGPDATLVSIQ